MSRGNVAALWAMAQPEIDPAMAVPVGSTWMLRCALLLSLITRRSVAGQPGDEPRRLGGTNGSDGPVIFTPRQRCGATGGWRGQGNPAVIDSTASAAPNVSVGSAAIGLAS